MKIKEGYVLKKLAGNYVVVPAGNIDFDGIITLNETGVFIWKMLENGSAKSEIIKALKAEYDVTEEKIVSDVDIFVKKLLDNGIIDE